MARAGRSAQVSGSDPLKDFLGSEVGQHIVRRLVFAVGVEGLQKPSQRLRRRIVEGTKRFLWDLEMQPREGLKRLAGVPPTLAEIQAVPFELPDLRKSKPVLSTVRLRMEYQAKMVRARDALRAARRRDDLEPVPVTVWATAFPDVPKKEFSGCRTAHDATVKAVSYSHRSEGLAAATIEHYIQSRPRPSDERRAADLDGNVVAAARVAFAEADFEQYLEKYSRVHSRRTGRARP